MAESPFPLNISEKQDSYEKLQILKNMDPSLYLSAVELNKIIRALNFLYDDAVSGGYTGNVPADFKYITINHQSPGSVLTKMVNVINNMPLMTLRNGALQWFYTSRFVTGSDHTADNYEVITDYYLLNRKVDPVGGVSSIGTGGTQLAQNNLILLHRSDTRSLAPAVFALGDIGNSAIADVINSGPARSTPNTATIIFRATQNNEAKSWLYIGAQEMVGSGYPGISNADLQLFPTDPNQADPAPSTPIFQYYGTIAKMLSAQPQQNTESIILISDASDDPNLSFDNSEINRQAFYKYNGVATGSIDDYTLISAPYADSQSGVQSVTGDGVDNTDPENPVLTFPTPAEIGAIEDAPSDGKQYGRKDGAWKEIEEEGGISEVETNDTDDILLTGEGTSQAPLEADLTQEVKDEIAKGVEAHDYTLDDVVQNGNETTKSIILSSEEHPSESVEIGVKEVSPGVAYGAIEIFSEVGYSAYSGNALGFSVGGKIATFSTLGLRSSFSDGKDLSINFPTDNPIPTHPNINTWFVLSVNGIYANEKGEIRLPNVSKSYSTIAALLANQADQSSNRIYKVIDASDDPNITFPSGETKLHAYYEYKETPNSDIGDYDLISAPYSDSSGGIDLSTGLEAIDEGNGIGWRLKGRNPANYGGIGEGAIDLGASDTASNSIGATGDNSTVSGGYRNEASGIYSTVGGGVDNEASGNYSFVGGGYRSKTSGNYSTVSGGINNIASGGQSTVGGGNRNEASGDFSTVSGGNNNLAKTLGEFLGGLWTTIKEGNATTWIGTDRIFGIGNGTSASSRSDAFNVYKNGVAELPSVTNALIDAAGAKTIPTKEWVQEQAINQQLKITANATVLADWNRHTVFLDGTNLEILVNVSTNELDENTEIYFYNMSDSEVDFKFTVVGGWSLPDDATLEPNGTCILMRVLDEQKLILIGNE